MTGKCFASGIEEHRLRRVQSKCKYKAIIVQVVQYVYCLSLNICFTGTVEILEQSVSVRAVQNKLWRRRGRQSNVSTKPRTRFAYQWPDNIEMYIK